MLTKFEKIYRTRQYLHLFCKAGCAYSYPLLNIAYFIEMSFKLGVFPNSLKAAKVVPVFKKDCKSAIVNHRSISVLFTSLVKGLRKSFSIKILCFDVLSMAFVKSIIQPTQFLTVVYARGRGGSGVNPPPIDDWKKLKTALFGPISVFSYRDGVFLCCIELPI